MIKHQLFGLFVLCSLLLVFPNFLRSQHVTGLPGKSVVVEVDDQKGEIDGYNLYLPISYTKSLESYPLIVFLQGGLGVGGNTANINNWALPLLLTTETDLENPRNQYLLDSFIIISPHLTGIDGGGNQFYDQEQTIRDIINQVSTNFDVDSDRIYITGLSRGGHGTWGLAARMPDVFAAAVPICGNLYGVDDFEVLKGMPIWVVHNIYDEIIRHDFSEKAVEELNKQGDEIFRIIGTSNPEESVYQGRKRIFSSINRNSHDAWTNLYRGIAFYKWLLQQRK